jgi:serine/threonine protein kinase
MANRKSSDATRNLRREAEALDRLAHPIIVRGFGAVLDGPRPHIVMEHLGGPTLRSLVKRARPVWPGLLPFWSHPRTPPKPVDAPATCVG